MVKFFIRLASVAAFSLSLMGCGGGPDLPSNAYSGGAADSSVTAQQCVPYARTMSGINIYGDAYTWWDQAEGRFDKRRTPVSGGVLILTNYAGPDRAHLAVVRKIDSAREIRVDHANWFNDGEVYVDDPVEDVSPGNDWSQVRVFNVRTQAWGGKTYPVQGFIAPPGIRPPVPAAPAAPAPTTPQDDPIGDLLATSPSEPSVPATAPAAPAAPPDDPIADLLMAKAGQ